MEMTLTEANQLIDQLQTAHRLSVGFYQRLLPLINRVASELELEFWSWGPLYTDRPSQSGKPPSDKWAWDLIPMFASQHIFRNEQSEHASAGDCAAVFRIFIDDNFKPTNRKALGIRGEPDPITMPVGSATLELDLLCCEGKSLKSFDSLWEDAEWPSDDNMQWESVGENMYGRRLTFSLAQLIAEPEKTVASVREELAKAPRTE